MEIFEHNRHVFMSKKKWDRAKVEDFIVEIFDAAETEFEKEGFWPVHPDDAENDSMPLMDLYMGAAGVIWGQKHLEGQGYGKLKHDYKSMLDVAKLNHVDMMDSFFKNTQMDNVEEYQSGLLCGELGFLVAQLKLEFRKDLLDELLILVQRNINNSVCEYMWGAPGSLAAMLAYREFIESSTFITLVKKNIDALEAQLTTSPTLNCQIWPQNLYGSKVCHIGAIHGFAGNAFSIIKSFKYLDPSEKTRWASLFRDTIKKTVLAENAFVNWPQSIDGGRAGRNAFLVQFCHGAPGVIACLSNLMDGTDPEFDTLMHQAGAFVFAAGPLQKGANLCHGTSGNGFAFLKLFHATGYQMWLDSAQIFAMKAMEQAMEKRKAHSQFRYSLWTGDIGLAIYLDACLNERAEIPLMDVF